ncbi:MAG: hypothetical protein Kilf2KO_26700 [Rhodospirillales bacterium]
MFGISVQKLLVLALVIGGIIVAFRLLSTLKRQQEITRRAQRDQAARDAASRPAPPPGEQARIQDMAACARCGAYIAAEAGGCGRKDCPYKSL